MNHPSPFGLARPMQFAAWVARATGPCCRATSPTEWGRRAVPFGVFKGHSRSVRQVAARHSQVGCATQYQLNRSGLVSRVARGSVLILLIAVFFGLGCRQSKPDQTRSKSNAPI